MRFPICLVFLSGAALLFALFAGIGVNGTVAMVLGGLLAIAILVRPLLGLALTIITNVLSPLLGSFDVSGMGLTLPRFFGAITVISWVSYLLIRRQKLPKNKQIRALIAFLAVVAVSVVVMPDHRQSVKGAYMLLVGVIFYLAITTLADSISRVAVIVLVISAMCVLSAGIGIVQYVAPGFEVLQNTEGGLDVSEGAVVDADSVASGAIKRVTGGLGDPNQFAYTLVTVLPLSIFWWHYKPARRQRFLVLLFIIVTLAGLALSFSRSGFFALAAAVVFLGWKRRICWPVIGFAAAIGFIAAAAVLPAGFWERTFSLQYLRSGSTQIRKDLTLDIIHIAKEHPIFGIGYGQLGPELYGHPRSQSAVDIAKYVDFDSPDIYNVGAHNLALEVLVEYGVLGFIPYVLFVWLILKELSQCMWSADPAVRELSVAVMAGLIAYFVCGIFAHETTMKAFWLLAGLALATRRFATVPAVMDRTEYLSAAHAS